MKIRNFVKGFAVAAMLSSGAHASIVSETAVADDWFRSTNSTYTSFITSGNPSDVFLRTFGYNGPYNRSALEFSLAGISAGSSISSATFTIQSRGSAVAGDTFQFWGYGGDGVITAVDALQTTHLLATAPTLGGQPLYTIDVTAFIQSLVNVADDYAGILITVANQGQFHGNDFSSSEWSTVADRPNLTINYAAAQSVPEPVSLALVGMGLAGLGLSRRKNKKA
ncbi:DNRLRE domain-containing protein [Dechloromonas sp.]|uniref:DNRLRE domain-containing protein n=1 Tax=Dechloromonas sp. TaxID=1917218 RepID=UPI00286DC8F7|nr:DNRLRE domain-containing protein [Dechloromonas sp.]